MTVTPSIENFVRLSVEKFYRDGDATFKHIVSVYKTDPEKFDDMSDKDRRLFFEKYEEIEEHVIKILFRVECLDETKIQKAHAIANIIDKTIGSNYCTNRPSDEQIFDIVNRHSVIE